LLAASKSSSNGQNPILGGIDGRKRAATTAPPSRRILPKITEASTGSESDSACSLVVPPVLETALTKAVATEDAGTSDSDDSATDLTIDDIFQVLDSVCCVAFCKHACVPTDISVLFVVQNDSRGKAKNVADANKQIELLTKKLQEQQEQQRLAAERHEQQMKAQFELQQQQNVKQNRILSSLKKDQTTFQKSLSQQAVSNMAARGMEASALAKATVKQRKQQDNKVRLCFVLFTSYTSTQPLPMLVHILRKQSPRGLLMPSQ
jgi:hypothetical protein